MTPGRRVLTIVACGAGPAAAISACVKLAQDTGWTVQVIATPAALDFFDGARAEHPVIAAAPISGSSATEALRTTCSR